MARSYKKMRDSNRRNSKSTTIRALKKTFPNRDTLLRFFVQLWTQLAGFQAQSVASVWALHAGISLEEVGGHKQKGNEPIERAFGTSMASSCWRGWSASPCLSHACRGWSRSSGWRWPGACERGWTPACSGYWAWSLISQRTPSRCPRSEWPGSMCSSPPANTTQFISHIQKLTNTSVQDYTLIDVA